MKKGNKHNVAESIKKAQLRRRVFTLDFKAEVARHKKVENLTFYQCGKKFDVLSMLIQRWAKQFEVDELTATVGRRTVSLEQAELSVCAKLSGCRHLNGFTSSSWVAQRAVGADSKLLQCSEFG